MFLVHPDQSEQVPAALKLFEKVDPGNIGEYDIVVNSQADIVNDDKFSVKPSKMGACKRPSDWPTNGSSHPGR